MNRRIVAVSGLILAGLALCASAAAQEGGVPRIVLSQTDWDFGTIWHGEKPSMKLQIRNEGSGVLKLVRVHPSCGCTTAEPSKSEIPPGDFSEVTVSYDSNGKFGAQTSSVAIFSTDPVNGQLTFNIRGTVKRAFMIDPVGGVVIRSIDGSAGLTGVCKIVNQEAEPMKVAIRSTSAKDFEVEIKETVPGKEFEILGRTTKQLPVGTARGVIVVSTGLSREPTVAIHLQANILPRVEAIPPAILLHATMDKPTNRIVNVQYYGNDPGFAINGVQCKNPSVKATAGPVGDPRPDLLRLNPPPTKVVNISVALPPAAEIQGESEIVEILTSDPQYPKLEVLITKDAAKFREKMYGEKPGQAPPAKPPAGGGAGPGPIAAPALQPAPQPQPKPADKKP